MLRFPFFFVGVCRSGFSFGLTSASIWHSFARSNRRSLRCVLRVCLRADFSLVVCVIFFRPFVAEIASISIRFRAANTDDLARFGVVRLRCVATLAVHSLRCPPGRLPNAVRALWHGQNANVFFARFAPFPEDVVSAVEFDETGDFIAAGDKGGRIVVFERDHVSRV